MSQTLNEILEREDVKYEMAKRQIEWRNHYAVKYSKRFSSFYYAFSFHWIFHQHVFKRLAKQHGLTDKSFTILMGCYVIAHTWGVNEVFGMTTVYETFFKDEMVKSTFPNALSKLRKAKLVVPVTRHKLSAKNKLKLRSLSRNTERLYRFSGDGMSLPYRYNQIMSKKITLFVKDHGEIEHEVVKILTFLIRSRNDMVGQDEAMRQEMDEIMKRENIK